jgi:flagellin-like hook-associated protein FlgL
MSGIILSSSVRQNLLSLQATADLLSTTQNRLATGKKVNTALDNPTNFFTAQSLDSRASDISNLLDGIGNGVQVLQQANTGLTSLQKLVDTAKSLANQALQTTLGYSTKSNVSTSIAGATATDLRGTTAYANATASSNVLVDGTAGGATAAGAATKLSGVSASLVGTAATAGNGVAPLTTAITLIAATGNSATALAGAAQPTDGQTLTVDGHTITFKLGTVPAAAAVPAGSGASGNLVTDGAGNSTVYLGSTGTPSGTVGDLLNAIDLASGVQKAANASGTATLSNSSGTNASIAAGAITLTTGTGADLNIAGKANLLNALGLTTQVGGGSVTITKARTTAATFLGTLIQDGSTLNINGNTITYKNAATPLAANVPAGSGVSGNVVTDGSGNSTVYLQSATIADTLTAIDLATGVKTAANVSGTATLTTVGTASSISASGVLQLSTGTAADLAVTGTGNALSALGLTGNTGTATAFTASRAAGAGTISGKTLTFTSFSSGAAVNVTFGDGTGGTVKTLDQLNAQLLNNNLSASIDSSGKLTVSVGNDYASLTLGSAAAGGIIGGTLSSTFSNPTAPVADVAAQAIRSNLVTQYNNILTQITTTAQDSSFNGVNLLAGDTLKLTFNETGKSTLSITGVNFNASGLGLSNLTSGADFIDNATTNKVVTFLSNASTALRTEGSTLGSNLSIVQIRQNFAKNLINVLQTGSSNLTLADTNEEAANSQALSTRQSIAVSALSLANQSQQSVLQLLR